MSDMRSLRDLYAHNTWANSQVFALCQELDQTQLEADAPGTFGTIGETLKHLAGVEMAYILMLRGEMDALQRLRGQSSNLSLDALAERAAHLGEEYAELLASADASFFDEQLPVPWFDFELTKRDGLLQVLSHSAQHRAQVLSVLGERGVKVPDLDYVLFVRSAKPQGGQET
jgi:uncharacterized damage-inducible protein DinB